MDRVARDSRSGFVSRRRRRISNYRAESMPLDITGARYEGPDAPERWWQDVSAPFDKIRLQLEREPIAVDQERVLALHHFEMRFAHTQLEGTSPYLGQHPQGPRRTDRRIRRIRIRGGRFRSCGAAGVVADAV